MYLQMNQENTLIIGFDIASYTLQGLQYSHNRDSNMCIMMNLAKLVGGFNPFEKY